MPFISLRWWICVRRADFYLKQKKEPPAGRFFFLSGGEGGIRTLEWFLAITRFPIVRARPGYATSPRNFVRTKSYFVVSHVIINEFIVNVKR